MGSGSWRVARTLKAEDCERLTVRKVLAAVPPVLLDGRERAEVVVTFAHRPRTDPGLRLALDATTPHYGGRRWWLRCPACGRRCGVLFRAWGDWRPFACRRCRGVAYHSQRLSPVSRWQLRGDRLEERARSRGIHEDERRWWQKPPRMRWVTFHRLVDDFEAWQSAAIGYGLAQFLARTGHAEARAALAKARAEGVR